MWAVSDSLILSLLLVMLVPGLLALVFRLAGLPQPGDGRLPVDPDAGDDAGALALPVPERHGPARQQRVVGAAEHSRRRCDRTGAALGLVLLGLRARAGAGLCRRGVARVGQVRQHRARHPRRRVARAVPRLPRRGLQAGGVHGVGHDLRRRGCALLPAGRHHQSRRDRAHPPRSTSAVWVAMRGAAGAFTARSSARLPYRSCRHGSHRGARRTWTSGSTRSTGSTGGRFFWAWASCWSRFFAPRGLAGLFDYLVREGRTL